MKRKRRTILVLAVAFAFASTGAARAGQGGADLAAIDPKLAAAVARFDQAPPAQRAAIGAEIDQLAAGRAADPNWSLLIGTLWTTRGQWLAAEPWLRRASAKLPDSAPAAHMLGVVLLQTSRPEEAEQILRVAVARFATDPLQGDLRFNLAMACALVRKRLEASEWFEKALELAPASSVTHFSLAENELNLQHLERAEAGFRSAMTLQPAHPDARWKLAVTLARRDRPAEAEALFREATTSGPAGSRVAATFQFGVFLFEQGRPAEALPALDAAAKARPGDRMCFHWLARAQRALGKKEEAAASLARYRELQAEADKSETEFLLGLIRDKLTAGDGKPLPDGG